MPRTVVIRHIDDDLFVIEVQVSGAELLEKLRQLGVEDLVLPPVEENL